MPHRMRLRRQGARGHRIVHGGDRVTAAVLVDDAAMAGMGGVLARLATRQS